MEIFAGDLPWVPDQLPDGGLLGVRAMARLPQGANQHDHAQDREAAADEQPEALRR